MHDICPQIEMAHSIHNERSTIADCLRMMGLNIMASKALDPNAPQSLITKFLQLIEKEAKIANRHDVLEILSFAGLIHGGI